MTSSPSTPRRAPALPAKPPQPLNARTLKYWSDRVALPAYDRNLVTPGVVHIGVGGFHRAGGTVLAGTDCPNVAIVSGFSLHRELELLVRAGLSPMEAISAPSLPIHRSPR